MERLTSNKKVSDMSMIELAHNSCYADDEHNARYRDYEMDMDARDFARNLMATLAKDEMPISDTEFDEEILDDLAIDPFSDVRGLIALFYRNLWAMANLRETLKKYEDLEGESRLLKLPCDKVYYIVDKNNPKYAAVMRKSIRDLTVYEIENIDIDGRYFSTKELAESKLKELRGSNE